MTSEISLKQWGIQLNIANQSFEKVVADYFRTKTHILGVAVNLEYSWDWMHEIERYITLAFAGRDSMKFETSSQGNKQSLLYGYNLWYVDSYKAFW